MAQGGSPEPTINIVSVVIKVFALWLAGGVTKVIIPVSSLWLAQVSAKVIPFPTVLVTSIVFAV